MHAHESQCRHSDLGMLDRDKTIQQTWKNVFVANKLGSDRDLLTGTRDCHTIYL